MTDKAEKTRTYRCLNTVKKGGQYFGPAHNTDEVELTEKQAKRLLDAGTIVEPGASPKQKSPPTLDGLDDLTVDDLKAKAAELGIDLDEIEGSGSKGNVIRSDIVEAIRVELAVG